MSHTKLKPLRKVVLLLVAVIFLTACSSDSDEDLIALKSSETSFTYSTVELEIFELVNKYRENKGLPSLGSMNVISSVAKSHNEYMVKTGSVNHDNFYERHKILVSNANAKVVGENVGFGFNTAQGIVDAWIASDGHRDVIENIEYTHFGISIVKDANGKNYFTQIFIKR